MKKYICECGKEFNNSQNFNGHKAWCKIHHIHKYGSLDNYMASIKKVSMNTSLGLKNKFKEEREQAKKKWIEEKHVCEHCGKIMTEKFGSGRFCSRVCANSKNISEKTKEKISKTLFKQGIKIRKNNIEKYNLNPNYCVVCGKPLSYDKRNNKTCCKKCLRKRHQEGGHNGGLTSATSQNRRSKNEIYFCELCEKYFKNVKHNEKMFKGWDADVVIEDIKCAVLWNGLWHYHKLAKNHSLKQTQSRDKIKEAVIKECGYNVYIIKDLGSENREFVEREFNKFINYLKENCII